MSTRFDRYFVARDKTPIHYEEYEPSGTPVRASLVIVHGAGEHAGRYEAFAGWLAGEGIAVYAMDLRGYGQSGGPRAFASSMKTLGADVAQMLYIAGLRHDGVPSFLLGHSLGGLIATYTAAYEIKRPLRGLLLSSPCFAIQKRVPGLLRLVAHAASWALPRYLYPMGFAPEMMTHDAEVIRRHREDKKIFLYMSARLYVLMEQWMARNGDLARDLHVPVLVLQAGEDLIVKPEASQKFFERLKTSDKSFKLYQRFFHEILQEKERQTVYDEMLQWMLARIPKTK